MKLYLHGLAIVAALLASGSAARVIVGALFRDEVGDTAAAFCLVSGSVLAGYLYRRWNGPLFGAVDRGRLGRVLCFILGAGTVPGLASIVGSDSPLQDTATLPGVAKLLVSIPVSGLGLIAPMFVGSLFHREPPSPDAAAGEWVVAIEYPDSTTAGIAVARLQSEAIPARVQNLASLPGLEPGSRVLVPASMSVRASEILHSSELPEADLEDLAVSSHPED